MLPHQLHLKKGQVSKMRKGEQVQLSLEQMGADKGKHIIFLDKSNAKKLMSSYKKGKGIRMKLNEEELEHSFQHGRGLGEDSESDEMQKKKSHGKTKMPRMTKGSPEAKEWAEKMKKARMAKKGEGFKEFGRDAVSKLLPMATSALGGVAGAYLTKSPAGATAGKELGEMAGRRISKALVGKGAVMSKAYKKALSANYGGLEVPVKMKNERSSGVVDKRVRPSSDEMTLSPYQKTTSPAMNPFIPMTYAQEGGTNGGYGDARPNQNIYGRGRKKMGVGLYQQGC